MPAQRSTAMPQFVNVAKVSDIPDQSAKCVEVNDRRICVVNLGGTFYAVDDTCTHAEASIVNLYALC